MANVHDVGNELTALWSRITGGMSEHNVTISESAYEAMLESYSPEEAIKYLRDSVAAWIWAHRDKEAKDIPRFYLTTSIHSEANTNRVNAYRDQHKSGVTSNPRDLAFEEIRLTESDYLRSITVGYYPEPAVLQPSPGWLVACQQLGRNYSQVYQTDISAYYESWWEAAHAKVGRVIHQQIGALQKSGKAHKSYAKQARAIMHNTLLRFLAQTNKIILEELHGELEYRIVDHENESLIREALDEDASLSRVDICIMQAYGVDLEVPDDADEEPSPEPVFESDSGDLEAQLAALNKKKKKSKKKKKKKSKKK